MRESIEILPLRPFTKDDIWPLIGGYETREIYQVDKTESDAYTRFDIRLTPVDPPQRYDFYGDFIPEELEYYQRLLERGHSFGAYLGERLVGVALAEAMPEDQLIRVWEIHVHPEFQRQGIGRALMQRVFARAAQDGLKMVKLETQNTNVAAVRFYRSMGFALEALDISKYFTAKGLEAEQVCFYMKRRLPAGAPASREMRL